MSGTAASPSSGLSRALFFLGTAVGLLGPPLLYGLGLATAAMVVGLGLLFAAGCVGIGGWYRSDRADEESCVYGSLGWIAMVVVGLLLFAIRGSLTVG